MTQALYIRIASAVQARLNCAEHPDTHSFWFGRWSERLEGYETEQLPSGSGIDCGTKINLDESTGERLVMTLSYHHMNESGMYDGWSEIQIVVAPSLIHDISLDITAIDAAQPEEDMELLFDYLGDLYQSALTEVAE